MSICQPPPWSCLWTDFEIKDTNGLHMTQGWLNNIKISNFEKLKKNFEKFSSLNASSNPKGERGLPEVALKQIISKKKLKDLKN